MAENKEIEVKGTQMKKSDHDSEIECSDSRIDALGKLTSEWLCDALEEAGLDLKQGFDCRPTEHRVIPGKGVTNG